MFVLNLNLGDPDDAGYFTNKTLNKLHGYIQHHPVKLAIFFNLKGIKIYANKKEELEALLKNKAVSFDINRHIFDAELVEVKDDYIKVFKRVHDTVYNLNKKVRQRVDYYKEKFSLDKKQQEEKKQEKLEYYQQKQQQQKDRRYFIINNKDKHFTIWLEVRQIKVSDFSTTDFNSYGLLSVQN